MTFTGSTTISGTSTTTMPPGTWGVPGFPIESILAGLLGGLIALTIVRRRRRPQLPTP
jgi:LytS/YehU family sensor histidine kinase